MTRTRREPAAALAGAAAAGALALSAGGQAWVTVTVQRRAPLPPATEALTGAALAPLVPAAGLLLLAAAVALVAVRGAGRVAVGCLAAAAGGALAWAGLRVLLGGVDADALPDGGASATALVADVSAGWPATTVLAGVLALLAGGLTALRGSRWPSMGRRYERPGDAPAGDAPAGAPAADAPAGGGRPAPGDAALDAWRALDRGEDPTEPAADDSSAGGPPGAVPGPAASRVGPPNRASGAGPTTSSGGSP